MDFAGLDSIFSGQCFVCAYNIDTLNGYRSCAWKLETLEGLRELERQRCAFVGSLLRAVCSGDRVAGAVVVLPIWLSLFWLDGVTLIKWHYQGL